MNSMYNGEETIGDVTTEVEKASTDFEKTNTELKRKYLLWNIEAFNIIASKVHNNKGSFGTGYPFYALDENMEGTLPIIEEQVRYNRELVKDGKHYQKSIWECKECLKQRYATMPDLKVVCNPCPNMPQTLKPRKLINRLPDIDMWLVCEDGTTENAENELEKMFHEIGMDSSDINPVKTIDDVDEIVKGIKQGEFPHKYLPIDAHIVEYSYLKDLITQVPDAINEATKVGMVPYLPIAPKSYRKTWQYDDEAYNFIYDYLTAFTPFNFTPELNELNIETKKKLAQKYTPEQLYQIALDTATKPNFRRLQSVALEEIFEQKVENWTEPENKNELQEGKGKRENDEMEI